MSVSAESTASTTPLIDEPARWRRSAWAAVLIGLGFVAFATVGVERANDDRAELVQREYTELAIAALEDQLVAYEEVLYGVRGGATVVDDDLTHIQFRELIEQIEVDERFPGVQVVGSAKLVDAADLDTYTARVNELVDDAGLDYPEFAVYPSTSSDVVLPIDHIEPQRGNERAFGLDFLSEPNRRDAALRARDTGRSAATAPITLVQETGDQQAFLMMLPVYADGAATMTVEQRRAAFDGVVYAAFRMDDLVAGAVGTDVADGLTIVDVESGVALVGDDVEAAILDSPRSSSTVVSGRAWAISVGDVASPLSPIERALPFGVALVGLLMVALMAELARSVRSTRTRSVELATAMTAELVDAERRASETSEVLLSVLSAATEQSIIATDVDGIVTVFNAGAERMLGYTAEEVVGRMRLTRFHDGTELSEAQSRPGDDVLEAVVGAARRGDAETGSWTYVRSDGTLIPIELTVTPRYGADGEICGFIAVGLDVTDRLRAAAQQQMLLNQEREMVAKLTEVDRVKSDFVSTMSHELRTPLTSIIGYTELLDDEDLGDESHHRMVGAVAKNAQRLLVLVEDLLTLSQVEAAQAALDAEDCDVAAILRAVDLATAPLTSTYGVDVELRIQDDLPVRGNAVELERVFLNLVTNAIKFSNPGTAVTVWARVSDDGERVVVRVSDCGIGIAEDELPQLFTRFFRSRKAQENVIPGTGLGLSIVASIVERHDGDIEVESVENEGTTMTVTLPTHPASAREPSNHRALEATA